MNHYWWLVISEVFETDLCGLRLVLCRFAGFKYSWGEQEDRLRLIDLSRLRCPSTVFNEHFRPQCLNTKHTQSNTFDLNTLTENTLSILLLWILRLKSLVPVSLSTHVWTIFDYTSLFPLVTSNDHHPLVSSILGINTTNSRKCSTNIQPMRKYNQYRREENCKKPIQIFC